MATRATRALCASQTGRRVLSEVREDDGSVTRKLTHKVHLTKGPAEVACTNFYLNDAEWALLVALPARLLRKRRQLVRRDGLLDVVRDVTHDEAWTGSELAR